MQEVSVAAVDPTRLGEHIGPDRARDFAALAAEVRRRLDRRTVWNVNSTASGGGVAEMLAQLVGYGRGAGVDTRWLVLDGDADFFAITKRMHNRLHGQAGDGGPLGAAERAAYDATTQRAVPDFSARVSSGDIVVLHDPQTAGLAAAARATGAHVVWRCHIGADTSNDRTAEAWEFLRPSLESVDHFVFSRPDHVPGWLGEEPVTIIAPAIDPFSAKNAAMSDDVARAVLHAIGVLEGGAPSRTPVFEQPDGSTAEVTRRAEIVSEGPLLGAADRYVLQVSRWDRLKDMIGVLNGFAAHVAVHPDIDPPDGTTRLLLVGPSVAGVSDDPEGQEVLEECVAAHGALPADVRRRVLLVSLPMDDVAENAAMVNALQRQAAIVVQKSLAEGFGLTVAEAMWKARPVIASAVGGIRDQIGDRDNGVLLGDPTDLAAFGAQVRELLADPAGAQRCGEAARERVRDQFLPDRQLTDWAKVLVGLL